MFQMIDDHRFILERYSTLDLNLFIQEIKVSPYHYESSFMSHNSWVIQFYKLEKVAIGDDINQIQEYV